MLRLISVLIASSSSEGSGESVHMVYAQTHWSLPCSHTQRRDVDESSDKNLDFQLCWIRQHGHLLEAFAHMCQNDLSQHMIYSIFIAYIS